MAENQPDKSLAERMIDSVSRVARRQERREELKELIRETIRDTGVGPSEEYEEGYLVEGFEVPQPGEGLIDKIWRIENHLFKIQTQLRSVSTKLSWVLWGLAGLAIWLLMANR